MTRNDPAVTPCVLGIGQCSWDYLAEVDSFPAPDTKLEVNCWVEEGGGPVATALVALQRLGIPCRFVGVVGDDGEGAKILQSLGDSGVDASGVLRREGARSQTAFIAVEKGSGRRTIFWLRPTGAEVAPGDVPAATFEQCGFLLLDGLMADVSLWGAVEARKRGMPVMLDAGRIRPGMLEVARQCDYVVAAEQFALDMGWDGNPASFRALAERVGSATVTVTLGECGSLTWHRGRLIRQPAFPVEVADTTGAGDVFHGAYVFGLLRGWRMEDVLVFASAVAALKCTRIGGRAGIPAFEEVAGFLSCRGYSLPPKV